MTCRLTLIFLFVGIMGSIVTLCFANEKLEEIESRVQLLSQGLNLTPEQTDIIFDILADAQAKFSNAKEPNEKYNSSSINVAEKEIREETNNKISAVLTPEQRVKFRKLSKLNPYEKDLIELRQRLSLNEKQTKSIELLMISNAAEIEALKNSSESKDPRHYHRSMKKIMDAQAKEIEKVLIKEQKKAFRKMRKEHEKKIKEKRRQM